GKVRPDTVHYGHARRHDTRGLGCAVDCVARRVLEPLFRRVVVVFDCEPGRRASEGVLSRVRKPLTRGGAERSLCRTATVDRRTTSEERCGRDAEKHQSQTGEWALITSAASFARYWWGSLERDCSAFHEHPLDRRLLIEQSAVGDDQVRDLALLDRAETVGDARDCRGVDRQRTDGDVSGEAGFHGLRGVLHELFRLAKTFRLERE